MEAAAVAASAAAAAARDAALAASVAAAAAAKDAAVAAANAREAASAPALKAQEAAGTASAAALHAKEAADVAATAGEAAAAAAAAMRASKKRKFSAVVLNSVEKIVPVAVTAGEAPVAGVALNAMEPAPVVVAAGEAAAAAAAALLAFKKSKNVDQDPQGSGDVDDDADTVDLISHLLDAVLRSIVSLLPTKEAARTQVISRRWLPLWRSAPLNLAMDHELSSSKHIDLISKILFVHPGPARRFSLRLSIGYCHGKINGWLSSQALDKLQEFELIPASWFDVRGRFHYLPSSVYRFAPTLRVAKFGGCRFSKLIGKLSLEFPCLKQLTLDRVCITEDALQGILSGCSALESLELKNSFGFARLCISSQTLKSICFSEIWRRGSVHLRELVIEDTPCLERFLKLRPSSSLATIRVISAPKLKIFGYALKRT